MLDEIKSNLEKSSESSTSQYTAPKYTPPENTFKSTSLSFSVSKYVVNSEETIYLSGKLIDSSGRALQNGSIYIKDEDTGSGMMILYFYKPTLMGSLVTTGMPKKWIHLIE